MASPETDHPPLRTPSQFPKRQRQLSGREQYVCSTLADVKTQQNQKSSLKRQEWSGGCPLIILLKDMKCGFCQTYDDRSEEKPDEAKIGEASKRSKKEHDEWQVNPCAH